MSLDCSRVDPISASAILNPAQAEMPHEASSFQWDQHNIDHNAGHQVSPGEEEAVLDNEHLFLRTGDG